MSKQRPDLHDLNSEFSGSRDGIDLDRLEGVRTRRILAFLVDYVLIFFLSAVIIFVAGILTLGIGWVFGFILAPLIAMAYVGATMGGLEQATPGMRLFAIKIERDDGEMVDFFLAVLHGVLFWFLHVTFTAIPLLVSLFSNRKRLTHDILLGTVIVRSDV